jgi:hypothetical protein
MTRPTKILVQTVIALVLGTTLMTPTAAAASGGPQFIPGYTDFPNALRVADEIRAGTSSAAVSIPGYTDFPNALRLQGNAPLTHTQLVQIARAVSNLTPQVATDSAPGFDWGAAGIGGAVVGGVLLALTAMAVAVSRTRRPAATS